MHSLKAVFSVQFRIAAAKVQAVEFSGSRSSVSGENTKPLPPVHAAHRSYLVTRNGMRGPWLPRSAPKNRSHRLKLAVRIGRRLWLPCANAHNAWRSMRLPAASASRSIFSRRLRNSSAVLTNGGPYFGLRNQRQKAGNTSPLFCDLFVKRVHSETPFKYSCSVFFRKMCGTRESVPQRQRLPLRPHDQYRRRAVARARCAAEAVSVVPERAVVKPMTPRSRRDRPAGYAAQADCEYRPRPRKTGLNCGSERPKPPGTSGRCIRTALERSECCFCRIAS